MAYSIDTFRYSVRVINRLPWLHVARSPQGRCKVVRKQDVLDMTKTTKLPSIATATRTRSRKMKSSEAGGQEPITRSLQLPHIPVTAFSQTDLFLVWIDLEFRSPKEPQWQSQARTNVDMSTCLLDAALFMLTEACSCGLELAYFAGKISTNWLVCKNAAALAYYGSCRLLVMSPFWSLNLSITHVSVETCKSLSSRFPFLKNCYVTNVFLLR